MRAKQNIVDHVPSEASKSAINHIGSILLKVEAEFDMSYLCWKIARSATILLGALEKMYEITETPAPKIAPPIIFWAIFQAVME